MQFSFVFSQTISYLTPQTIKIGPRDRIRTFLFTLAQSRLLAAGFVIAKKRTFLIQDLDKRVGTAWHNNVQHNTKLGMILSRMCSIQFNDHKAGIHLTRARVNNVIEIFMIGPNKYRGMQ